MTRGVSAVELVIGSRLFASMGDLQYPVMRRVLETLDKLKHDPDHSGLDYKLPQRARDRRIRTCRINDNYRLVCAEAGRDRHGRRTIVALAAYPHDEAYTWASRQQLTIDGLDGAHVVDVAAVEDVPIPTAVEPRQSPLIGVKDVVLTRFGVPEGALSQLRRAASEVELEVVLSHLPGQVADAVRGLAAGYDPDEVWAEISMLHGPGTATGRPRQGPEAEPAGPDQFALAVTSSASSERFHVFAADKDLERALLEPMATWRVFLHPRQAAVATRRYSGPARVTGGPGTGKSVVAMHRAAHLARLDDGPVLLTTFTRNLAQQLQTGLRSLLSDTEMERVQVVNVDALTIAQHVQRIGAVPALAASRLGRLWSRVHQELAAERPLTFYVVEWRDVIEQRRVTSLAEYLRVDRSGRGTPLNPPQRQAVWRVLDRFARALDDHGLSTFGLVADQVVDAVTESVAGGEEPPFRHVVVDEAQDLSAPQWRLLRALVAPGPDDLFIVGDGRQRIYAHQASLRSLGIETRGRSQRLRLSYRSTGQILGWAEGILSGAGVVDLGQDDAVEAPPDVTSLMSGPTPSATGYPTPAEERDGVAALVRAWVDDPRNPTLPQDIAVAVRTNKVRDELAAHLHERGIPAYAMIGEDVRDGEVTVATMHRLKGMEFRAVAVADVKQGTIPNAWAVEQSGDDERSRAEAVLQERCLLYVACTRARERLAVSWSGDPSPLLVSVRQDA